MAQDNTEYTYYFSKIPKITAFHPTLQEKYKENVDTWGKRTYLEAPNISDQTKIWSVGLVDPDAAEKMKTAHNLAKKTENTYKTVNKSSNIFLSPYMKATPEAKAAYEQYKLGNLGGKKSKTIKKKNKKNKKNKKRRTQKKY